MRIDLIKKHTNPISKFKWIQYGNQRFSERRLDSLNRHDPSLTSVSEWRLVSCKLYESLHTTNVRKSLLPDTIFGQTTQRCPINPRTTTCSSPSGGPWPRWWLYVSRMSQTEGKTRTWHGRTVDSSGNPLTNLFGDSLRIIPENWWRLLGFVLDFITPPSVQVTPPLMNQILTSLT